MAVRQKHARLSAAATAAHLLSLPPTTSPTMSAPQQTTQGTQTQGTQTQGAPATSPRSNSQPTNSASATNSRIPQTAAVGGLTITMPPETATSFFKIAPSQPITIGWNFTSLYSQPAHLTVRAVGENSVTYPVGPNDGTLDGKATELVWDLHSYNQANPNTPLAPGQYNLRIWDDRGPDARRAPGLFVPNNALKFALYTPEPYTPLADGEAIFLINFLRAGV